MYRNMKISMSVPAYNEEKLIIPTLEKVPEFVDKIYVVDDGSIDQTAAKVIAYIKRHKRVELIKNEKNRGNGYSVIQAFKRAIDEDYDINCIIAGDDQCRQEYLASLIDEVIDDNCEYAKANRFQNFAELQQMPKFRKVSNILMSFINKFATGYYSVFDPLNSFSATKVSTLAQLDLDSISHRYDFENSYLLHLYLVNARVKDVAVPALYGEEKSTIKLYSYIPRTSKTLFKSFFKRIYYKYVLYSLHPIAIFYITGIALFMFGLIYCGVIAYYALQPSHTPASTATVMIAVLPLILGFQLLLQAVVLDIQNEPK